MTVTSKDVFAKRREGALDEAYGMALGLNARAGADDWDRKALAWCCIDLIKRSAAGGGSATDEYRSHLETIDAGHDEILHKQIQLALSLSAATGAELAKAKALSKSGKHFEAATAYRKLIASGSATVETHNALSWELYRLAKLQMDNPGDAAPRVKALLNEHLRLQTDRPSLVHSCMLQLASSLAGDGKLDMAVFSRMWGLQNFRPEDYERFKPGDGKDYPALVEKVLQQAAKSASKSQNYDWSILLPHLKAAVARYPDNRWLKLRYARALLAVDRAEEAFAFALQVVKALQTEYWAWELLGDIEGVRSPDRALACYGKALSCGADEKFVANLRIKFAALLAPSEPSHSRLEIERVVRSCEQEGTRIPPGVEELRGTSWFSSSSAAESNGKVYARCARTAELLLADDLAWVSGNVGEIYPDPKKEGKFRRRLVVQAQPDAFEISVPASKYGLKPLKVGEGIRFKGEFNSDGRFQIYLLEARPGAQLWDAVAEHVAVVDHVNREKRVVHFVIRPGQDGLIRLDELGGDLNEGDSIAIRRARYVTSGGARFRVLSASRTSRVPSTEVRKDFRERVRVDSGMGFTDSAIFVPPPLVAQHGVQDGAIVGGVAVVSFNKKRSTWGWRAISLHDSFQSCS